MVYEGVLEGEQINLRAIALEDCEGNYLSWLQDEDVNRYLESRLTEQTLESTRQFVQDMRDSADNWMFAIVLKETGEHVGNIKAGPVHPLYKNTFLGYIIGEKRYWGKGLATEAIRLAARFCFEKLHLHKVSAGVITPNAGSARALEKAGFKREAVFREEALIDGKFVDVYRYGLLREEF